MTRAATDVRVGGASVGARFQLTPARVGEQRGNTLFFERREPTLSVEGAGLAREFRVTNCKGRVVQTGGGRREAGDGGELLTQPARDDEPAPDERLPPR